MTDVLDLLQMRQFDEALLNVRALVRPKWGDEDSCKAQYEAAIRLTRRDHL